MSTSDFVEHRCQAWIMTRKDGVRLGFTDHDEDLMVNGTLCQASSGLNAVSMERSSGLAADNTEAIGALSSASIEERDITKGLYDTADIQVWSVNWRVPGSETLRFRGHIGQITRVDGEFRAEIRGLSDVLNQTTGRVYQASCDAVLGDGQCKVDLSGSDYRFESVIVELSDAGEISISDPHGYPERWFERGSLVLSEQSGAVHYRIKRDQVLDGERVLTLWNGGTGIFAIGDRVRVTAGCDKSTTHCRDKFGNLLNYRGFPHIPGEDWMTAYPSSSQVMNGGRR